MDVTPPDAGSEGGPAIDREALQERLGDDGDLIGELAVILAEDAPRLASECAQAIAAGDWTEAHRLAHTLRGAAGNLCARRVQAAAGDLERCARQGLIVEARAAGEAMQREVTRLLPALGELQLGGIHAVHPAQRDV
jgi:two-component system, sensor histidine kinase and response regulator